MEFSVGAQGEVEILTVNGAIHAEDNDAFAGAFDGLRKRERYRLVIDGEALEYMNSRAVGTLVAFSRDARVSGGKVVIPAKRIDQHPGRVGEAAEAEGQQGPEPDIAPRLGHAGLPFLAMPVSRSNGLGRLPLALQLATDESTPTFDPCLNLPAIHLSEGERSTVGGRAIEGDDDVVWRDVSVNQTE